jgi:hypothetical protein
VERGKMVKAAGREGQVLYAGKVRGEPLRKEKWGHIGKECHKSFTNATVWAGGVV